ncbi:hypothetical protein HHI36_004976 [Cryptolaemus montrouzieri]|uniref:Uncharacterized protein n=1 Tax=Cryptolaemus montrouzieri TaxID=559131 RepID=A0ABD2NT03_9CUCU
MQIQLEDTSYWIYISADGIECFKYHKEGHIAKHCPVHPVENYRVSLTQILTSHKHSTSEKQPKRDNPHNLIESSGTFKRPLSTTDSEPLTIDNSKVILTDNSDDESIISDSSLTSQSSRVSGVQRKIKKKRTEEKDMSEPESTWISIGNMISEEPDEFEMSVEQIKNFLDKAYGRSEMVSLGQDFSPGAKKIVDDLRNIYNKFTTRGNKSRITRIIKKIEKELNLRNDNADGIIQTFENNTVLTRKPQIYKEWYGHFTMER